MAGRLVLALLPAQPIVHSGPLAYDLVLEDAGCVCVSVSPAERHALIVHAEAPRPEAEVDFRVLGDLRGLARLLTAGPVRRRLGRGLARIEGERGGLVALRALARAPLLLSDLHGAGAVDDPELVLTLAAQMIDPRWTSGQRFTIAYHRVVEGTASTYLQIRDGDRPQVTSTAPLGPVSTTVVCPPQSLLPMLDGCPRADVSVRGDERPLRLVERWLQLAQSG